MSNETQDSSVSSDRKIICTKLSKDFSNYMQRYQRLSREWVVKEKTNPAPKLQTFSFNSERKQLNLVDSEIDFNDEIIAEREAGILEIQRDLHQLNDMFKDMNQIVTELPLGEDSMGKDFDNILWLEGKSRFPFR